MSTFKDKNSLRKLEAQIVQKLKRNDEARQNLLVLIKKSAYIP